MDRHPQETTAPLDPADLHVAKIESKRRLPRSWMVIATAAGMTVGYVLSPGLIILLDRHGLLPDWSIPITQAWMCPLAWAHNNSRFVSDLYKNYFWLIGADL